MPASVLSLTFPTGPELFKIFFPRTAFTAGEYLRYIQNPHYSN
jgi:hypothetical protein